jgi:hypothetical protein
LGIDLVGLLDRKSVALLDERKENRKEQMKVGRKD